MKRITKNTLIIAALGLATFTACDKDNDDVPLPNIDGYANSDAVASANLVAYWPLDGSAGEAKQGLTATASVNASYTAGVKGQGLSLANGYIYYAAPLTGLTSNQPWTLSAWLQVANNQIPGGTPPANNHPYQYFQAAIPTKLFGSINGLIEAGQYDIASDTLVLKSIYQDLNGGTQDNINNYGIVGTEYKVNKKAGTSKWVHVVTTYNPTGGTGTESIFQIWADSVMVSNINFQNRGSNSFMYTPGAVIIGGWYNNIPGLTVSADTWTTAFTGKIDEIRVFSKLLTTDEITALYHLGQAGR
jgi:hypothetical protein